MCSVNVASGVSSVKVGCSLTRVNVGSGAMWGQGWVQSSSRQCCGVSKQVGFGVNVVKVGSSLPRANVGSRVCLPPVNVVE